MSTSPTRSRPSFAAVAIGRNEGERLKQCLRSLATASSVVYVDSGSEDGSCDWARSAGVFVVSLDLAKPFTAARARNEGFKCLNDHAPHYGYLQFIDGDCELVPEWPDAAISFLETHLDVAAVAGRRRERFPDRSVYNWLCDREWATPVGQVKAFGGDVMMRRSALEAVGGYRDDMIAGEEPELGVRLRAAGWKIWRLDTDMSLHDAGMTRFVQWWRRCLRGGYAYALGAHLHGASPEHHKVRETWRAWAWGIVLPIAGTLAALRFGIPGLLLWLVYPLQVVRLAASRKGPFRDRLKLAFFQTLAKFPEAIGQVLYLQDQLRGRYRRLIEYK